MELSIVIPCFNEAECLPDFCQKTINVLNQTGENYELLFVDDGSKDRTLDLIKQLSKENKRVFYISFSRNFGKEAALYAGLKHAKGDFIAVMDADLQDPPELLLKMIEILKGGDYDCAAARRITRNGEPKIRSFFAGCFYKIINKISDAEIMDGARDFRMMKKEVAEAIVSLGEYNRFSKGIFGWVGFRTCWLPYENIEREKGKTKWNFWKLFRYAINGIIDFSEVPLNIASWFGLLFTVSSFITLIFIICRKLLFNDPVAGWTSLVCIILFIGGVQMFCIGVLGKYIANIYMECKRRPVYITKETNISY